MIPSYKRAGKVECYEYFPTAKIVIPENQERDYVEYYDKNRIVTIPEKEDGNIARKRNWILKNIGRPLLMVDDDVKSITTTEKRKNIKLSTSEAMRMIIDGFNLAHQLQCVLWGINLKADARDYQEYKPFSLTGVVLGPFQGHLDHELLCDEEMGTKDDYDFSIQALNKYKKILRINKYAYECKHGDNEGGIVSMRTMADEIKYCRAIEKKWGRKIIKYPLNPKKPADLLNGQVKIPIAGV